MPLRELVVVTGVSGSGKSSLVFDTLYAEGQRRYVETFSPVRAAVPRPHGQAAGRSHRRHSARDRDRPDEPGAHLALDGRHDDRAQRSPEAPVRARGDAPLPRAAAHACAATRRRPSTTALRERARRRGRPACSSSRSRSRCRRTSPKPKCCSCSSAQGYTRDSRAHDGRLLEVVQDRLRIGSAERVARHRSAGGGAARRPGRVDVHVVAHEPTRRSTRRTVTLSSDPAHLALFDGPALRRLRHSLSGSVAEPVLVQFAARRLRDLPRLRPHHRHRLRARRFPTKRRRCAAARSSRGRRRAQRMPGRPASSTRRSAAFRSTCRGATGRSAAPGCSKASRNG